MPSLEGKKILILDESPLIRDMLKEGLESDSAEARAHDSSASGILDVIHWNPDLIIAGVEIGVINGFQTALIIKMIPQSAAIPIIIMSSGEKDTVCRKASDVGADFYISKDSHVVENIKKIAQEIFSDNVVKSDKKDISGAGNGKVMVVDDSSVMRTVITNMLKKTGVAEVCHAKNGEEALRVIEDNDIGLVLTDWNMPKMNGLDLIKALRSIKKYDDIPIIMVTTESAAHELDLAQSAGADGHISKPFSMEKIKEVIYSYSEHVLISYS